MKGIFGIAPAALLAVGAVVLAASAEAAPASPWSGLYLGGQAGYGAAVNSEGYSPSALKYWTAQAQGATAGVFAGYNFLPGGNWLTGVELEGNWSDIVAQYYNSYYGDYSVNNWSAAGRVRFGYLTSPNTLFYGSLGLAAGNFDYSQGYWAYEGFNSTTHTLAGVQFGAGVETFITPKVSVRAEGVLTQYDSGWIENTGVPYYGFQPTSLTARVGIAFHPGWLEQHAAPAPKAVAGSWTGFYVGADAGAVTQGANEDYNPYYYPPYDPSYSLGGTSGEVGGHAGFNWRAGALVAGVEAEGFVLSPTSWYGNSVYGTQTWSAAVRARLGFLAMDNTLLYGSVGWAAGGFDYSGYWGGYAGDKFTGSGLQLGAGAEAFLTPQFSARVEGLYTDYGKHTFLSSGSPYWDVSPRTLEARVGLSYHLN